MHNDIKKALSRHNLDMSSSFVSAVKRIATQCELPTMDVLALSNDANGKRYAVYSPKNTPRQSTLMHVRYRIPYRPVFLSPQKIDVKGEFIRYFVNNFIGKILNTLGSDGNIQQVAHLETLFQYLVHDGEEISSSIDHVSVHLTPKFTLMTEIPEGYEAQEDLYCRPTSVFSQNHDVWQADNYTVNLFGERCTVASQSDFTLGDALRRENLAPILRHLMKLWVIRQCSMLSDEQLKESHFFGVQACREKLGKLEKDINQKMTELLAQNKSTRHQAAEDEMNENFYLIPTTLFKLAQRIPFIKLIVGASASNSQPSHFYLKKHGNGSLIKYLMRVIYSQAAQSTSIFKHFISGRAGILTLCKGMFNALSSVLLAATLPILSMYFILTGLTSYPVSLFRQWIRPNIHGWQEGLLTLLEIAKDGFIGWRSLLLTSNVIRSLSAFVLPRLAVIVGTSVLGLIAFTGALTALGLLGCAKGGEPKLSYEQSELLKDILARKLEEPELEERETLQKALREIKQGYLPSMRLIHLLGTELGDEAQALKAVCKGAPKSR